MTIDHVTGICQLYNSLMAIKTLNPCKHERIKLDKSLSGLKAFGLQ